MQARYCSWIKGKAQCWAFLWKIDKWYEFPLQVLGLRENRYVKSLITWWWQDFGITCWHQEILWGDASRMQMIHYLKRLIHFIDWFTRWILHALPLQQLLFCYITYILSFFFLQLLLHISTNAWMHYYKGKKKIIRVHFI